MSREYFVIDARGEISFSADQKEPEPEAFATFDKAKKRARELAKSEPGETVVIAKSIAFVTCEVSPPKVAIRERKLTGRKL